MNIIESYFAATGFSPSTPISEGREATSQNLQIGKILDFVGFIDSNFKDLGETFWRNERELNDKIFYAIARMGEIELAEYFYKNNSPIDINFNPEPSDAVNSYTAFERLLIKASELNNFKAVELFLEESMEAALSQDTIAKLYVTNQVGLLHKIVEMRLRRGSHKDISFVTNMLNYIQSKPSSPDSQPLINAEGETNQNLWETYLELIYSSYSCFERSRCLYQSIMDRVLTLGEKLPREIMEAIGVEMAVQETSCKIPRDLIERQFRLVSDFSFENIKKVTILASHAFQANANRPVSVEEKKICAKLILNSFTESGAPFNAEIKTNIIDALSEIPDFTKPHIEEALKKAFR